MADIALLDLNLDNIKPGVKAYAANDAARFAAFQTWANTYVYDNVVEDDLGDKIDLGGNRIINVQDDPTADSDLANMQYVIDELKSGGGQAVRNKAAFYFKKGNDIDFNTGSYTQAVDDSSNTFEVSITTQNPNAKILIKCSINITIDEFSWFRWSKLLVRLRKYYDSSWADIDGAKGNEDGSKERVTNGSAIFSYNCNIPIVYVDETSYPASTTIKYSPWFKRDGAGGDPPGLNYFANSYMAMSSIIVEEIM
jgi:hypothetical protein